MQLPFEFMTVHTQSNGASGPETRLDEELLISQKVLNFPPLESLLDGV